MQTKIYSSYRLPFLLWIILLGLLLFTTVASANAGEIRVEPNGTDQPGCGSDILPPCKTLQYAVDQVSVGGSGIILVAAGNYVYTGSGTSQTGREVVRIVGKTITMKGGYNTGFTIYNPGTNLTVIDGQNSRRVITVEPSGSFKPTFNLAGVTLTRGYAPNDIGTLNSFGGALDAFSAIVRLDTVIVANSTAQGRNSSSGLPGNAGGGALSFRESSASLSNVTLTNNMARGGDGTGSALRGGLGVGGGLFAIGNYTSKNCAVSINNLTANNNTAQGGNAPGSNGVDSSGVQRADGLGGGLSIIDCTAPTFNSITIADNTARGGTASGKGGLGLGGGLFVERNSGTTTVTSAQIRSNQGIGGSGSTNIGGAGLGGGIFSTENRLAVQNTTLLNNNATGANGGTTGGDGGGGGIYIDSAAASVSNRLDATNVIIGSNSVRAGTGGANNGYAFGGGVFMQLPASASSVTGVLTHVTLASNLVTGGKYNQGAALFVNGVTGRMANVEGNFGIISSHTGAAAIHVNGNATFNHTLWDGNTTKKSGVGGFQDNFPYAGSPNYVDPTGSPPDFHITGTSAALNLASASHTAQDVDGEARPYHPLPNTGVRDLGADEYYPSFFLNTTVLNPTSLSLNWGPSLAVGLNRYEIEYSYAPGANNAAEGSSPINVPGGSNIQSFILSNLTTDQPYLITIVAYNINNTEIDRSNSVTATPVVFRYVYLPVILN